MDWIRRIKSLWAETRRRKVFRAASIYLVAMWTVSLGAAELFPAFGIPDWGVRLFVIAAILGFPLVVAGAWVFEITSEGVVLDSVAKSQRDQADQTRLSASSGTTTWAQMRHVVARWRDDSGEHEREYSTAFIMGRDAVADLQIDDPRISRLHARVSYERGQWWIEDLSSRNGTNVDGQLITEKTTLGDAAVVYLYEGGRPVHLEVHRSAGSDGDNQSQDGAERVDDDSPADDSGARP